MERRALYNTLRMSWQLDSQLAVQPWQVENYRNLSLEELFQRLQNQRINVDRFTFVKLSENCDSPEEMTELLSQEEDQDENYDKVYLAVFELWRRLIPGKQSLSIFCDELDYQIHLYDSGQTETAEGIEDAIANLQIMLEDADGGLEAKNLFSSIANGCANDIEDFLYDYIQVQIEHQNDLYAQELIEGFSPHVQDRKWFDFLKAEILYVSDQEAAIKLLEGLVKGKKEQDLEFNFEILSFLAKIGKDKLFKSLAKQTFALLELEEDFIDFANICADFFHFSDHDEVEQVIHEYLATRKKKPAEASFDPNASDEKVFLKFLK
ncbi:Uncharacterized protein PHSC3_000162 [Chlamydiales bacterium STE3]|nr:Uncharacterized protein PHSC3_000162 [Chlamydiales bacterium STE3]